MEAKQDNTQFSRYNFDEIRQDILKDQQMERDDYQDKLEIKMIEKKIKEIKEN